MRAHCRRKYDMFFGAFKFRLAPTWYEGMLHVQFSHVCADLGPRWSSVGPLGPISVFPLSSHSWARADDGQAADNGHLVSGQQVGVEVVAEVVICSISSSGIVDNDHSLVISSNSGSRCSIIKVVENGSTSVGGQEVAANLRVTLAWGCLPYNDSCFRLIEGQSSHSIDMNKLTKLGRDSSTIELANNSITIIVRTAGRASWNCQDIPHTYQLK